MRRIKYGKNRFKSMTSIAILLIFSILLCSCGNRTTNETGRINEIDEESQKLQQYIEANYGIADNVVYERCVTHPETDSGVQTKTYDRKLKEGYKLGAVFYKSVAIENYEDGYVCVYLSDEDDNGVLLKSTYRCDGGFYTKTLSYMSGKRRCYVIVKNDYFIEIEISDNSLTNDMTFCEEMIVHKLTDNGLVEMYTISREIEYDTNELKAFSIKSDSDKIVYAAGYSKYISEGAVFVSTQKEFCDKANELLKNISLDCIVFNKTSWNNRWFGMSIDESGLNNDMVKVDFTPLESVVDDNGYEVYDTVIKVNDEKQPAEGEQMEEIDDSPVIYGQTAETTPQEPIVMPDNIPQSVDVDDLQDLRYFDIDGFWHSSDNRYVYHIYTKNPDNGFGTLYFVDLEGRAKAKHGQVKQTSSYSVILKAMESNEFSPEVFSVNGQLVSDEINLIKADSWIASGLIGTWSDSRNTYSFDGDGTYSVKKSNESYWGRYFIIDENKIALGRCLDDYKVYDFSIVEDELVLNDYKLVRQ